LFLGADHVISLTRAGVHEFSRFPYLAGRLPPYSVIPTCTNLEMFQPDAGQRDGFTLGYVGSVGSWYLFGEVAAAVQRLFVQRPDARFLVINQDGHQKIRTQLSEAGVDLNRVEIRAAPFAEVARQIARMDAGIFFIKPAWSKRASCPTRMGEFLACGKPCLANEGVGDVGEDLHETGTGIALPVSSEGRLVKDGMDRALESLQNLAADPDTAARCRAAAEARFSLQGGIAEYDRIYCRLSEPAHGDPSP
jgi:hypothetical protein